ncbi:hypothetical protein BKA62DRAFT_690748 [Auriculariales sp. MPI-PUGE-AT-0066]|nr:hypothetical protein BKA62DRAFT_690748 [Auriculariales sp. MPI-PUGE-AT-0066]
MSANRPALVQYGRSSKKRGSASHRDDAALQVSKKQRIRVDPAESDDELALVAPQISRSIPTSSSRSLSPPHAPPSPPTMSRAQHTDTPVASSRRTDQPTHVEQSGRSSRVIASPTKTPTSDRLRNPPALSKSGSPAGSKRKQTDTEVKTTKRPRLLESTSGSDFTDVDEAAVVPSKTPSPAKYTPTVGRSRGTTRPTTPTTTIGSFNSAGNNTRSSTPSPTKTNALTQLFGPSSPSHSRPSSPTKQGVARRMLARSRTESSIGDSSNEASQSSSRANNPSPAAVRPYTSLPVASVSTSNSFVEPTSPESVPSSRHQSSNAGPSRPSIRTYASARSFLVSLPPGTAIPSQLKPEDLDEESQESYGSLDVELQQEQESYSVLRQRWGVDAVEDEDIGLVTDIKSGSEMKNHGEMRLFWDDVGYLLEGLESDLVGVQRTSAIELLEMLSADGFVTKARSADFLNRAWIALCDTKDSASDPILLPCIGIFCAIISKEPRDLAAITRSLRFTQAMNALLIVPADRDPLRRSTARISLDAAKRFGLKRNEVPLVKISNRLEFILQEKNHLFAVPPSSPKLASTVLSHLPPRHQAHYLSSIITSMVREMEMLTLRGHLELDGSGSDVEHLRHCIRIVDALLLDPDAVERCHAELEALRDKVTHGFVRLCTTALQMVADDVAFSIAHDLIDTILRILINLTNGDVAWCEALIDANVMPLLAHLVVRNHQERKNQANMDDSQITAVSPAEQAQADALDRLCLSLAVLTNVVQESPRTAEEWMDTNAAWSCSGESGCLPECSCEGRTSALDLLVMVFVEQSVKAEDETNSAEAHFLHGHLAVLLVLLAHQNSRAAVSIQAGTPLLQIIEICREWLATYELSQRRLAGSQGYNTSSVGRDTRHGFDKVK